MLRFAAASARAATLLQPTVSSRLLSTMAPSATPKKQIIVFFGPSGVGKSTLIKRLFTDYPDKFGFSVSHTTRAPRPGEQDGVAYHFVTREKLQNLIDADGFIEHAEYSGNHYGTSKQAVQDVLNHGKICILDIDSQGVRSLKQSDLNPKVEYVFIAPPSAQELEQRLRGRNTETEASLQKRLDAANAELRYGESGEFEYIIVNDNLDRAYAELKKVVDPIVKEQ